MNMDDPITEGIPIVETCMDSVNTGPHHLVVKAALHALHEWMIDKTRPPSADLLQTDAEGNGLGDEHGNALGCIRTPHVDVPIATLKTENDSAGKKQICYTTSLSARSQSTVAVTYGLDMPP